MLKKTGSGQDSGQEENWLRAEPLSAVGTSKILIFQYVPDEGEPDATLLVAADPRFAMDCTFLPKRALMLPMPIALDVGIVWPRFYIVQRYASTATTDGHHE